MRAPAGRAHTAGRRGSPGDKGNASEVLPGSLVAMWPCYAPPQRGSRPHQGHTVGAWWRQVQARNPQANFSPPWPNPPASWHSWPPLPGQAGLQHQALPAHQSSPRCCGQTGLMGPQKSIPAEGRGGGSGADGYLGARVQVESLEGPDLARRRTGRGKTPDQGAVGDVAFASW